MCHTSVMANSFCHCLFSPNKQTKNPEAVCHFSAEHSFPWCVTSLELLEVSKHVDLLYKLSYDTATINVPECIVK